VKDTTLFNGNNVTGRIEFLLEGGVLKVQSVELTPNDLNRKDQIICSNQVYKAK
jgi:hypothetical protein